MDERQRPHVVCVPFPAQGHVTPFMKLAKLLHWKGFHVTFVNTEYNHRRLLRSRGPHSLDGLPSFRFESIPDGLEYSDADVTQEVTSLVTSVSTTSLAPFRDLLRRLNSDPDVPPVTCVVADGVSSFTLDASEELGIPNVLFWTTSACGFLAYSHYKDLIDKGIVPFQDLKEMKRQLEETVIDWIPGMKDMRLRDIPSFIRTTDKDDVMFNFFYREVQRATRGSAIMFNTYQALEKDALDGISAAGLPTVYTVGPLHLMKDDESLKSIDSSLWREDPRCIKWLDSKALGSVVYVNFGSITVMTSEQLVEFAYGLAGSGKDFLWVVRPDLVAGDAAVVPPELVEETKERGMMVSWCSQAEVLQHPAVGGFLTHSGWNSTLESLSAGVVVISWPFFAEQKTNCRYSCREWGIGMEIEVVERGVIEGLVRELMDGEKGRVMAERAAEWKRLAVEAADDESLVNLDKMISEVLLGRRA